MIHHRSIAVRAVAVGLLGVALAAGLGVTDALATVPQISPSVNALTGLPVTTQFNAISCAGTASCTVAGNAQGAYTNKALSAAGNPASWGTPSARQLKMPASVRGGIGTINAIHCVSAVSCVGVGYDGNYQPFSVAGNPASWGTGSIRILTLGPALGSGGQLYGVSCTSATQCTAVGSDVIGKPMVITGNPSTWSSSAFLSLNISSGELLSVSCTSPTTCTADGDTFSGAPITVTGDPTGWSGGSVVTLAVGSGLGGGGHFNSIDCTTATSCLAVGESSSGQAITLDGDPTSWSGATIANPGGGDLRSVHCTNSTQCVALGTGVSSEFVVSGNPATWTSAQMHVIGASAAVKSLVALSCASSTACTAAGGAATANLVFNGGSSWSISHIATFSLHNPAFGPSLGSSHSLACASPTDCVAVGDDTNNMGLIMLGSLAHWSTARAVELSSGANSFDSLRKVVCVSTTCVAIGSSSKGAIDLVGNPATWSSSHVRTLHFTHMTMLNDVTCWSPTSCEAVGTNSLSQPIVLRGNPASWGQAQSRQLTLPKKLGSSGTLEALSCPAATRCVATGYRYTTLGYDEPVFVIGNPASWGPAQMRGFALGAGFGRGGYYSYIDCATIIVCVAVGHDYDNKPISAVGNAAGWSAGSAFELKLMGTTPSQVEGFSGTYAPSSAYASLLGVSCASSVACVAIGDDFNNSPVLMVGNPASWRGHALQRLAKTGALPAGTITSIACLAEGCYASGNAAKGMFLVRVTP